MESETLNLAPVQAVIEICKQPHETLPLEVLRTAYIASCKGTIILVLHEVEPRSIDKVFDELVHKLPLNIPGVLYFNADNLSSIQTAVNATELVFFQTSYFKQLVKKFAFRPIIIRNVSEVPGILKSKA